MNSSYQNLQKRIILRRNKHEIRRQIKDIDNNLRRRNVWHCHRSVLNVADMDRVITIGYFSIVMGHSVMDVGGCSCRGGEQIKEETKDGILFMILISLIQLGYIWLCTAFLDVVMLDFKSAFELAVIGCTFNLNFFMIMWLHSIGYYKKPKDIKIDSSNGIGVIQ